MKRFWKDKKTYFIIILGTLFSILVYYILFQTTVDNKAAIINRNNQKLNSIVSQINFYLPNEEEHLKVIEDIYYCIKSNKYNSNIDEIILGIIKLKILILVVILIYLIMKTYYLQIKRKQDFWIYKMERMEMLIHMSAGIAHEIRNPLSTVKGYLQINHAKEPSDLSYAAINDLQKIEDILNKSLKLSEPLNENKDSYKPYEIIEEIYCPIEALGLLKDVDIEYNIDKSLSKISFPKNYIRFIILDIVQHVIKAQDKNALVRIEIQKINEKYMEFNIHSNKYKRDRDKALRQDFINMVEKIIKFHKGNSYRVLNKNGQCNIHIEIPFDLNE